jgi:hypothetical protein
VEQVTASKLRRAVQSGRKTFLVVNGTSLLSDDDLTKSNFKFNATPPKKNFDLHFLLLLPIEEC